MNTLRVLEEWKNGSKSRSVSLHHDNGFGATPGWVLTLEGSKNYYDPIQTITIMGCPTLWESEMSVGYNEFFVPSNVDDWVSLEEVIKFGLQKAEELGL